jgi:hypothetical protein
MTLLITLILDIVYIMNVEDLPLGYLLFNNEIYTRSYRLSINDFYNLVIRSEVTPISKKEYRFYFSINSRRYASPLDNIISLLIKEYFINYKIF